MFAASQFHKALIVAAFSSLSLSAFAAPVAIGYQAPLTGEYAQYGNQFRNAANLALDEYNQTHKAAPVVIKFADSKGDALEGVSIAHKFSDDNSIVGVIGDFSSTVSIAAGKVYAETHLAQLSQTASHPDFVKISPWQFRNIITEAFEGPYNARWISQNNIRKVAVISIQNDWGQTASKNFAKSFKDAGGEVTALESFNPGTRDFRAILTKVARTHPDAIYLALMYEDGAALLQQKQQLGFNVPVYGSSSMYEKKLIQLAGPAAEGVKISTTFTASSKEPNVQAFVKAYQARYHVEPSMFAGQAYDATRIMLNAIAKAGGEKASREAVRNALAATKDFPGVTGNTTFDPVTREPSKNLSRLQIRNGDFTSVAN
ncbi:ABC transporter substrate-binding protein [Aquitalea sp. ASV11]|uniref:ABC transporter substrate-binding protein n=1 Tax=Aquitalea sp. ASV11 TaxID=2795103 RepID=UPI0018EB6A0F|nr:ABC transporter substrate-binding protein [Aquitalea sp. ASV11]